MALCLPEVGDAQISLLAVAQVRLGDEDVAHGQHPQATNFLWTVEDDRREPTGHLTVQTNLDTLHRNTDHMSTSHELLSPCYMGQYCGTLCSQWHQHHTAAGGNA